MKPPKTTREQIYQAVVDLADIGEMCTRTSVQRASGLKQSIVDDQLKALANDMVLYRPENTRGVYVLSDPPVEDRAVSVTMLPSGRSIIEMGEDVLSMSYRETRLLRLALGGGDQLQEHPRPQPRQQREEPRLHNEFRKMVQRIGMMERAFTNAVRQRSLEFAEDVPCKPQSSNVKQGRA